MNNKKHIMCLECGNVQVRTDIKEVVNTNYIVLSNQQVICPKCSSKRNIMTDNIKKLSVNLEKIPKERQTGLERKILSLVR